MNYFPIEESIETKKPLNVSVYMINGRLQITADVDATDIDKLESILSKYKEILKLMSNSSEKDCM